MKIAMAESLVTKFASLFSGRTDAYGSVSGACIKDKVTAETYCRHLLGTMSVGIYPLRSDGTCCWGAVDVDFDDLAKALRGTDAVVLAVRHEQYRNLKPDKIMKMTGKPVSVIDCFGILDDDAIRRYFELGCEVKGLGRGHINRIKDKVRGRLLLHDEQETKRATSATRHRKEVTKK